MPAQSEYGPFLLSPPLTSCEQAYIVFGQGSPPYTIDILPTSGNYSNLLETLPIQHSAGYFHWTVDFQPGANITFALTDKNGQHAYSDFRVVQAGEKTSCPKNDYTKSRSTKSIGAIVGGVLGALAVIGILLTLYFLHRRRRNRRLRQLHSSHQQLNNGSKVTLSDSQGGSGLRRAGTFNLGNVRFTEPSLDHLRQIDHPPSYEPPPAIPSDGITEISSTQASSHGISEDVQPGSTSTASIRRTAGERQAST
ncbi:uncharacterized protein JCM6883_006928 [Sporobolomyces salmoneus]|uniref:uncharacterized protein n=1 Tax=Sporobolomyces salmoneus TaxID=183962 RepID=UPI003170B000